MRTADVCAAVMEEAKKKRPEMKQMKCLLLLLRDTFIATTSSQAER